MVSEVNIYSKTNEGMDRSTEEVNHLDFRLVLDLSLYIAFQHETVTISYANEKSHKELLLGGFLCG